MSLLNSIKKIFRGKSNEVFKRHQPAKSQIRIIPKDVNLRKFYDNLLTTKHYCEQQLVQFPKKLPSEIFRSYNPEYNGRKLFEFNEVSPFGNNILLTKWAIDPLEKGNINLVRELYFKQLTYKNKIIHWTKSSDEFKGIIIAVDYEATIPDGVSEWESEGLFDIYDLPPIDTWFYITKNDEGRKDLYAWIPEAFSKHVKNAIEVNLLDLIHLVK